MPHADLGLAMDSPWKRKRNVRRRSALALDTGVFERLHAMLRAKDGASALKAEEHESVTPMSEPEEQRGELIDGIEDAAPTVEATDAADTMPSAVSYCMQGDEGMYTHENIKSRRRLRNNRDVKVVLPLWLRMRMFTACAHMMSI